MALGVLCRAMLARVAFVFTAFLAGGFLLVGCDSHKAPPAPKLALVAAAGGFGDDASAGLSECKRQTGIDVATAVSHSPSEGGAQIVLFATQNYDPVIAIGPLMVREVAQAARRFQNLQFGIVDGVVDEANVESITFDEQQGAFLAGALAAMVSQTKTVAFLGGDDVPQVVRSQAGFAAGAAEIAPTTRVLTRYLGSFTDRAGAQRLADSLFTKGADIAFVVAGPAGLGAIDSAVKHRGTFAIGVDSNQDALAPGHVLTSVVKHVDVATQRLCLEAISQKPTSGHTVLGLAEGGIGLTNFTYTKKIIGVKTLARLERIRRALIDGTITPPATAAALRRFRPVPIR